ncbi:LuxR family transcriptional regulator [Actinotalea sp. Marseille-Q4924]|uniref:helix-turn-helix transcriptional regulator n=1 Tax=Actinotalea sp. Marseille-Q4924 TaxID=2866571 RepID=UPI001CE3E247|nr:LuxR family transcriptional regulator [Actinotalea sp. Marseille-Q4924]
MHRGGVVGRAAELEELGRRWDAALAGRSACALVVGGAGVGKSTLLRSFLAAHAGAAVLRASGGEFERDLAHGVVSQLLADGQHRAEHTGDDLAVGARLVAVVDELEQEAPVVLAVDDVGWADLPSLRALTFAVRRLRHGRVLTVLTVRPEHLDRLPTGLLDVMTAEAPRLDLEGLDEAAVAQLVTDLGHVLPASTVRRLASHTGGNPLHVRALLDEVGPTGLVVPDDGVLPAPRAVADRTAARLAALPAQAADVVLAVALLGPAPEVPLVLAVAGRDDGAATGPALDDALRSGLVRTVAGVVPRLDVDHPLVRSALLRETPHARRALLHARAAAVLDGEDALRHRASAAVGYDGALASELALAGEAHLARPGGAAAAAAWFRRAAAVAPDRAVREDLLLRALEGHLLAGDAGGAATLLPELPRLADSARRRYVEASLRLAAGDFAGAQDGLLAAWRSGADGDPGRGEDGVAWAVAGQLAALAVNSADLEGALLWSERALALPARGRAAVAPAMVRGVALTALGRYDEAREATRGDEPGSLTGRGVLHLWTDDLPAAVATLADASATARAAGELLPFAAATYYLAEGEFRLGRWDDAALHAGLVASVAADGDQRWFLALPHGTAALPAAHRGEWDVADRHVAVALELAGAVGDAASVMWARTAEASVAVARGEHARALAAAQACLAHPALAAVREVGAKPWRALGAEAAASLGDVAAARALLAGIEDGTTAPALRLGLARARALVALAAGDDDDAGRWFERAHALAAGSDAVFERALLGLSHGAHLRRRGERRRAADLLADAATVFADLRAVPWLERAQREVVAAGGHAVRERRHPVLTPQEQAVAHLVARGMRNKEVAAELFVTVKTVEYHLASVFRKTGVTNRAQLVARLAS